VQDDQPDGLYSIVDTLNATSGAGENFTEIQSSAGNGGPNFKGVSFAPYLPGDFDLNGHVNAADIVAMEQALANLPAYESARGLTNTQLLAIGDINNDGKVNNADLQALIASLKSGGGSSDPVPEPSTFILALVACGMLVRQFRHGSVES
ncbi:MAG TPA: dockerin type I repeat-containing protein, partial [Pirellulales bacterium]|nr:dockerin type I repeat-containing protein [Pirellulales bacterium]